MKGDRVSGTPRSRWKRWGLRVLWLVLLVALSCGALVGFWYLRYSLIVGAKPGGLSTAVRPGDLGEWVNPFIGTGGFPWVCGHNFPGAMVPFGVVRLSPETSSLFRHQRALNTSGYYYGDNEVLGFSHTRLSGTGATDGGHFLVSPAVGPGNAAWYREGHVATTFSHHAEVAFPGYYAVHLPKPGVLVELTATPRVGVHRYTFSRPEIPHLLVDVSNALGGRRSAEGRVRVLPGAHEVEGSVRTFGTFAGRYGGIKVYFVARTDRPFSSFATWGGNEARVGRDFAEGNRVGVDLGFDATNRPQTLVLQVAISHVSIENARANLQVEAAEKSFDELVEMAKEAWEEKLSLISLEGGTERQKSIFYTALYRLFQMPTVFNDANSEYLGFDRRVHRAEGFRYFTDLSLWDTFRTVHPLLTLIAPKDQRDMLMSLVKMLEQGGWLPRWPAGNGYSNSMLGTPADIVITDSYLKGLRDFDVEKAYRSMRQTALAPTPPGSAFSGRRGVDHYLKHQYCPAGLVDESVSRTFEYGWADSAISRLAEALGRPEDAAQFREHSHFYRNLWNTNTQYFQPRDASGHFLEPFKPLLLTYLDPHGKYTRDYVEGSALQWRWGAPYDAQGMISLFQSRQYFVDELNSFFAKASSALGHWFPGSYYWHGNQPDIHAAYLFNEAGRPDLTQEWVRWILDHKYGDTYAGLDGNDDGATLSAWYLFSALGLYPVPGSDVYQLGTPLFKKAEVQLGDGRLVVLADRSDPAHYRVQKVYWNDSLLDRTWLRHAEIEHGGVLRFVLGP
jgi:predicted alpha-1,2-mannosidase